MGYNVIKYLEIYGSQYLKRSESAVMQCQIRCGRTSLMLIILLLFHPL